MPTLQGRVAIVTGGAQGLGLAIASRLAAEGASVLMADIQADKVAAAAGRIGTSRVHPHAVDVTSSASVEAMVAAAVGRFGKLDILVNVAGGSGTLPVDRIEELPEDIWKRVVDVNVTGTFLCCKAAAPYLRKSPYGRIVNFSSGAAKGVARKGTIAAVHAYATSKAALHGLTNQLAIDLGPDGVLVNVLQPGFVLTEPGARVNDLFQRLTKEQQMAMLSRGTPRKPDEVGWAVATIASDVKRANGAVIYLSGELTDGNNRIVEEPVSSSLGPVARLESVGPSR